MKKYIGTKQIEAEPMHEISAANMGVPCTTTRKALTAKTKYHDSGI